MDTGVVTGSATATVRSGGEPLAQLAATCRKVVPSMAPHRERIERWLDSTGGSGRGRARAPRRESLPLEEGAQLAAGVEEPRAQGLLG